ncbi:uncharacterized protein FRV6_11731 [Fusarium oxysporum]|uniref:Uncharacterized protein n=1 Tax=Fusarium oxysporum TaxID=5507 RepID=A0A2H3TFW7_FUSOX|nr:uncharacterized protein FRV6_11731 [Fusarium oxysporum]
MVQLTVGSVAGLIAAGIFFARQCSPNALTYILSWLLGQTNTAATWTIASGAFQQSYWPVVLRTDAALGVGVRKDILWVARLIPIMGIILSIASVVTPLGLYDALVPGKAVQASFVYAADTSPFGYGTAARSNYSWSRRCGYFSPIPCPFSDTVAIITDYPNGTTRYTYPYGINVTIPDVILETYSSGTRDHTTVSNFFDIQWRRYATTQDWLLNNGSAYLLSNYRNVQSLILNNAAEVVEGLVVDMIKGGVGFRNHTVPPGFSFGVTWEEDLLFIEPETVCVDTNLTLDYTIVNVNGSAISDVVLTDRGGFVNLNQTFPKPDYDNPQANPDLYGRAYIAAWLHNAYTAVYLNVTNPGNPTTGVPPWRYLNSAMNQTFLRGSSSSSTSTFDSLVITSRFNDYLDLMDGYTNASDPEINTNIFKIKQANFTSIHDHCGYPPGLAANITNILVNCGLMRGVPQRQDPGTHLAFETGSKWSQKMFACATAVKATIKTVSLTYNRTDGFLQTLAVTDIKDKQYTGEGSMPLWGVEEMGDRYRLAELNPIWGLVSPAYQDVANVSTVRQPSLFLPGWVNPLSIGNSGLISSRNNLPGSDFSVAVLSAAYNVGGDLLGNGLMDYTGESSIAMWARWQNLSSNAETAALIPNLIFADISASAVVGTKGVLGPGNTARKNPVPISVTPMITTVRYHIPYAIPAAISALLLFVLACGALLTVILRQDGLSQMREHLQGLSPGRIYTTLLSPGQGSDMLMRGEEWSKKFGRDVIDLSGGFPNATHARLNNNSESI